MSSTDDKSNTRSERRDSARTREAILAAALQEFSTRCYAEVGTRDIARLAGVDAALIKRYFGSKELLYRTALDRAANFDEFLSGDRSTFGERVAQKLVHELKDKPHSLLMPLFASSDESMRSVSVAIQQANVLDPLGRWLGADGAGRAARISMICSGFLIYSKVLPLHVFGEGVDERTTRWLASALQQIVDEA